VIFDTNVLINISKNILKIENIIHPATQPKISVISYIEALGFPFRSQTEESYMFAICFSCGVVHINDSIINATINIRRNNKAKLPDAIIYATALIEGLPLMTSNIADFKNLGDKVELIDPFAL